MEFIQLKQPEKRKKADLLVLPFWNDKQGVRNAGPNSLTQELSPVLSGVLATKDFSGKEGEIVYVYSEGLPERRIALLGLGVESKATVETLRRSYGCLTKSCLTKQVKNLNLILPQSDKFSDENLVRGVAEGLLLPNYVYTGQKHRQLEEQAPNIIQKVTWIGNQRNLLAEVEKIACICRAVDYTRNLANGNADDITPYYLAQCALDLSKNNSSIKTTIFDKKRIEKEKLSLLLAVNRGSALDPYFIIMEYKGDPSSKEHVVLVGKGITYDTGGLNLKPTGSMETMKTDMSGAAACFGTLLAVSELKLKVNLTVVVPSTENGIDARSFKPGDVYMSYAGKSVEMTNSDAEGRLILADGLAYACKNLKPTKLIDIATLTGAIEIALGPEAAGMMSTDDELAKELIAAGERSYERVWRMPLFEEYKDKLKSDIADMKSWNGRSASANVAATFLRFFVDESVPWAHLDIAGTAYTASEPKKYLPKYATGMGVGLLVDFLENQVRKKK